MKRRFKQLTSIIKLFLAGFLLIMIPCSCTSQNKIEGNWRSASFEKTSTGTFGVREFSFEKDAWEIRFTLYLDSALKFPMFTFRANGTFSVGGKSERVNNARKAIFRFDKKYLTVKTQDTALIRRIGFADCGLVYLTEKDITETGCAYLVSRLACAQEYDLVSRTGDTLYLGARPLSGGICEEAKRPGALGLPLRRMLHK
jgi:hypothetical protein